MDALLATVTSSTSPNPAADAALSRLRRAAIEATSAADGQVVFEAAVRYAVVSKDRRELEKALVQLRPWGMSDEFAALELLLFLVESRLSDLFASLELIPVEQRRASTHVSFVVALERHLTEGSYDKVLRVRSGATSPLFGWLLDDLEHTVRDEVASCVEVAYHDVSVAKAAALLNLATPQQAREFAGTRPGWRLVGDRIEFEAQRAQAAAVKAGLTAKNFPTDWIVRESLNVASDLDRII